MELRGGEGGEIGGLVEGGEAVGFGEAGIEALVGVAVWVYEVEAGGGVGGVEGGEEGWGDGVAGVPAGESQ